MVSQLYNPDGNIAQRHPAETAAPVAMAIALLISRALGAGEDVQFAIAVIVSFVPTAITWAVIQYRSRNRPPETTYQRPS